MATTFQEALDRTFPQGRTFYCTKCRCCEVEEMGDMCVFCEDGVICPKQKLRQKQPIAAAAKPAAASPDEEREAQISELRSALMNQGWRLPRAKSVAARVVDDNPDATFEERFRGIMSGNFGSELAPVKTTMPHRGPRIKPVTATEKPSGTEVAGNVVGQAVKREKEESVPKKEFDVEAYKKLVAKGLDQKAIAAEMGIGYSTLSTKLNQARRAGKLSSDRPVRPPSKIAAKEKPARKVAAAPATNGHANGVAVATLTVTESALDNFWTKLPIEEKARIVQENLIGALGQ